MDGQAAIERNVEALKRILLSLVAMAGLGQSTLPRHLHRAILRLLRPAEAAARRLIIALALAATPQARETGNFAVPPWRGPVQKIARRRKRHFAPKMPPQPAARPAVRRLALPLTDPLQRPLRRAAARPTSVPRLWTFDMMAPQLAVPARRPPALNDPLDATRLRLRLDALGRALSDLPRQALRFARWQARQRYWQERGAARLRWPLRPGRPPGSCRGPRHEVHAVLDHAHHLGWWALNQPSDTS
jgi:hypothetical protein